MSSSERPKTKLGGSQEVRDLIQQGQREKNGAKNCRGIVSRKIESLVDQFHVPDVFKGVWQHSRSDEDIVKSIFTSGWKPVLCENTIYGTAVYLSRKVWLKPDGFLHDFSIRCVLDARSNEVNDLYCSEDKNTQGLNKFDLYLNENGLVVGKPHAEPANSPQNLRIRNHIRGKEVRAVGFMERGNEVIAVYDPSCITILGEYIDNRDK